MVLDGGLSELGSLALDGKTMQQGLEWLGSELAATQLQGLDYDMPHHPIQDGATFRWGQPDAFNELALWFNNAARVLRDLDLGDVRCWPHHFDLASLITLGDGKSIGVGMSPGDTSYDEPYWYVAPWPRPDTADLPELPMGHWHSEGFVAAILTGTAITEEDEPARQREKVEELIGTAVSGSKRLLA
jgi:hypothetical protein